MSDDWIADSLKTQRGQAAGAAIVGTRASDPDAAARANILARKMGLPADAVERNYAELNAKHTASEAVASLPTTDTYLHDWLANSRNAAASRDDVSSLALISGSYLADMGRNFTGRDPKMLPSFTQSARQMRPSIKPFERDTISAPQTSYLGSSLKAGLHDVGSAAMRLFAAIDPTNPSEQDIAELFKDDPEGMKAALASSPYGVAARQSAAAEEAMANADVTTGGLSYATLDPEHAAWASPTRVVGDALRSLPTTAALVATAFLTRGASIRGEAGALAAGMTAEEAKAAGVAAAQRMATRFGAASEGVVGYAQQAQQTVDQIQAMSPEDMASSPLYKSLTAQGYSPEAAQLYIAAGAGQKAGIGAGVVDTATNLISGPILGRIIGEGGRLGARSARGFLTEGVQEAVQSGGEQLAGNYANRDAKPSQSLGEGVLENIVQGFAVGGLTGGVSTAALGRAHHTEQAAAQATIDSNVMGNIMDAAAASKLRARDPEAFQKFVEGRVQNTPAENVYIPAEAIRDLMQDSYYDHPFWGDYSGQIDEALALDGDVVIPTAHAATHLAGTPEWEALKDEARFSPGGMSAAELQSLQDNYAGSMERIGSQIAEAAKSAEDAARPAVQVYRRVRDQLANAGFAPDAADRYAQLWAANREAWAARMGTDALSYHDANPVQFRRILPEALSRIQAADGLDIVINAMKRGKDAPNVNGPSLLDFISKRGGIEDRGGDLASMGGDKWHREQRFRRKLIRPHEDANQGSMIARGASEHGPDTVFAAAIEAGYFPEYNFTRDSDFNAADAPDQQALYDAIDAELRGTPRFSEDERRDSHDVDVRTAAEELRAMLAGRGLDPDTASNTDIKNAIEHNQEEARQLDQTARGRALLGDNPGAIIDLFQGSDLSTVIHETGHVWLEELKRNASADGAPADVAADWEAVKAWFAEQGHPVGDDGFIPTEAHEVWARGWERYTMEGKAPSSALQKAFDAFRGWLLQIYKHVNNLRAPITPAIRDVFDRMLATQDAIDEQNDRQGIRALFTDAAQAGMTEAEFAAYQASTTQSRSEAFDALLYRTMATIRRARTKAWKDEAAGVRDEVAGRMNARPDFRALTLLRTGAWLGEPDREAVKVKLNRGWLVERYGSDALAMLPKGVPPIYSETGTDADTIAEMAGFRSGDEMVRALMGIETAQAEMRLAGDKRNVRNRMIDEETDAIMKERHGDPLSDGSIEEEALAAINNDGQGEVIAAEARALGKRRGEVPTPYQVAREWAARKIAEGKVVDVASRAAIQRYARAAAKAARGAEAALIAGDTDEAFRQKQAQMLNQALLVEAKNAADAVDAAVARLSSVARRATIKSVDQDYLDRAHAQLEKFDFRGRSQRSINEQQSFAVWAAEQRANGVDVVIPPRLDDAGVHYTRMSVEELKGLDDSIKQLMHLGRLKQKLIDAKEERDFNEVVAEAVASAGQLRQRPPSDLMEPGWRQRMASGVASVDAALLKLEQIFDWLDGGPGGVFSRVAFRPIAEAQDRENDMTADYLGRIRDLLSKVPNIKRWSEKVALPELTNRDTGNPWVMTRQQLISMALNMGNEGNVQRLTDGYGWNERAVREALNRELKPEDWTFVQGVWDTVETLWPQIASMEKRINGVEPEKVEAMPVPTPGAELRGGYYPAIYDATKSLDAEANAGKESDLFSTLYTRANTTASATKARVEKVNRPILLDLGVINRHLLEVIHDITHREAVMNADKFLSSRRVMAAVDASLGPEIRKQFRPWLKFVANRHAVERAGNEGLGKWMNKARANTTIVGMGFRFTTIISQLAGYSNSAEYVGAGNLSKAIAASTKSPIETFNFVMERSGEVRHRMDTLDRDIGQAIRNMGGRRDVLSMAKRFAFHGIGYMDRIVAVPTWMAGYNKALAAGMSEADAIYEGDKAVRLSQGAGSAKDLAAVQRGTGKHGELLKLMTMFYSYLSAFYQRERTLGRDVGDAVRNRRVGDLPGLIARAWWLIILPPILTDILSGRGPDDDEDWGEYAFKKILVNSLGPIPGFRDLIEPTWDALTGAKGFDFSLSPLQRAGQSIVVAGKDVHKIATGDDTKHATRDILEAVGYTSGLVPGQIATSTQFLVDVGNGDADPHSVGDWLKGLQTGKLEDERGRR